MIRRATPGDLEEIVELCRLHADYEGASYLEDGQAGRLSQAMQAVPPKLHLWVVDDGNGGLLGYMSAVTEFVTWLARDMVYMDCLYLREGERGRGWGRRLIETLREFAGSNGIGQLQWQTPPTNDSGIAFYDRIGATRLPKLRFFLEAGSRDDATG